MKQVSVVFWLLFCTMSFAQEKELNSFEQLDGVLQVSGKMQDGGVYKFSWPRTDLQVKVNGISIEPGLALGSWAAFKKTSGADLMTMGDLVLLPSEVNPVIRQLQSGGFEILGIHNHVIGESPQIMYVHFAGHGSADALGRTIKKGLQETKTPLVSIKSSAAADVPAADTETFQKIQTILDRKGNQAGKVLHISVPRAESIQMGDEEVPPSMGMATVMNFQMTGARVAATGDFVLIAKEVNPVIQALQANGIQVTALHNHMMDDSPRLFFLHFWANDTPGRVAQGLKLALAKLN